MMLANNHYGLCNVAITVFVITAVDASMVLNTLCHCEWKQLDVCVYVCMCECV